MKKQASERTQILNTHQSNTFHIIQTTLYGQRYADYRQAWETSDFTATDFPLHIDIDLRAACNMRCSICNTPKESMNPAWRLEQADIDKICTEAAQYPAFSALNIGSAAEPLLDKPLLFYSLHAAAKAGAMDLFVHTNGYLMDEACIESLLDSPLTVLCISLDAVTPETYIRVRGVDGLARVEHAIQRFLSLRTGRSRSPALRVSFCVNPHNAGEKDAFLHKWQGVADWVDFQPYVRTRENLPIDSRFEQRICESCEQPFKRLQVGANGNIYPCCCPWHENMVLGNIRHNSIFEAWHSERASSLRVGMIQKGDALPPECRECLSCIYHLR